MNCQALSQILIEVKQISGDSSISRKGTELQQFLEFKRRFENLFDQSHGSICESNYKKDNQIELRRYLVRRLYKDGIRHITEFKEERAMTIEASGRLRFIDKYGNFKGESYYSASNFSNGRAKVIDSDDKTFFIDLEGNQVTEKFDKANDYSEGLASVQKNNNWFFINKDGKRAFEGDFNAAESFSERLAAVKYDGNYWGFINKEGEKVLGGFIIQTANFNNGLVKVKIASLMDGGYFFMNEEGERIAGPFDEAGDFYDGIAMVVKDKKTFYIDVTGKKKIERKFSCKYEHAFNFSEGFALVGYSKKVDPNKFAPYKQIQMYYFLNQNNKRLSSEEYFRALPFHNGFAAVADTYLGDVNFAWTFINKNGITITSERFEDSRDFGENGLAPVKKNNKWFYINGSGERALVEEFDEAHSFKNGLAMVEKNGRRYYIDSKGRYVMGEKPE